MKTCALILAGGDGKRMKSRLPKQFLKIDKRTLLERAMDAFEKNKAIDAVIVVTNPKFRTATERLVTKNGYRKVIGILNGGATRRESSATGVAALEDDDAKVLIHDASRPLVSDKIIGDCLKALDRCNAVAVAIPSSDTIIKVNGSMTIKDMPQRRSMMRAQTPQGFKTGLIKEAHRLAKKDKSIDVTDDCAIVLKYGLADIHVVKGDERNIKITYPEDIYLAEKILKSKKGR